MKVKGAEEVTREKFLGDLSQAEFKMVVEFKAKVRELTALQARIEQIQNLRASLWQADADGLRSKFFTDGTNMMIHNEPKGKMGFVRGKDGP